MAKQYGRMAFSIITLVALHSLLVVGAGAQLDSEVPAPATSQLKIGPISFETSANVTLHQDRLRFSKSHYKIVMRNAFGPANAPPLATQKKSILGELIRCENLTLARPDAKALIGCHSLESYVTSDILKAPSSSSSSSSSNRNVLYALRYTIKIKDRYLWTTGDDERRRRKRLVIYRLRPDVVELELGGSALNSESGPFQMGGFYGELTFGNSSPTCTFLVHLAFNNADAILWPSSSGVKSEYSIYEALYSVAQDGFEIKLKDLSCTSPDPVIPITMDTQFHLRYQPQFPYWSLKHHISTSPLSLWTYQGHIEQTRADEMDTNPTPEAYNTTIKISSTSSLFEKLLFEVDQVFVNQKGQTGWELMDLIHSSLGARVESKWTPESFAKLLKVWPVFEHLVVPEVGTKPSVLLKYIDEPTTSEYVELSLKLERSFFASLFSTEPAADSPPIEESFNHQHNEL